MRWRLKLHFFSKLQVRCLIISIIQKAQIWVMFSLSGGSSQCLEGWGSPLVPRKLPAPYRTSLSSTWAVLGPPHQDQQTLSVPELHRAQRRSEHSTRYPGSAANMVGSSPVSALSIRDRELSRSLWSHVEATGPWLLGGLPCRYIFLGVQVSAFGFLPVSNDFNWTAATVLLK